MDSGLTPFELIAALQAARIFFSIRMVRDGALMFEVAVPGERWEIEVFDDGHFELERFLSDGEICSAPETLQQLIAQFTDTE